MPNLTRYLLTCLARFTGGKGWIMLGASYGFFAGHAMATLTVLDLKSIYRMFFSGQSIRTSHIVDPEILHAHAGYFVFFTIIGAFVGITLAIVVESKHAQYERAEKRIPGLLPGISSHAREPQTQLWLLLFIPIVGYVFLSAVFFAASLVDIPLSSG